MGGQQAEGPSPLAALTPVFGLPMQALGVDSRLPLRHGLVVRVYGLLRQGDDVLALVVVDEIEVLQGRDEILLFYTRDFRQFTAKV